MAAAVGARIRSTRVARRISLGSLASATGLGKGTLSELERGLRNPTLDTLFAIATCLDLPLSQLLVDDDAPGRGHPTLFTRRARASTRCSLIGGPTSPRSWRSTD